MPGFGNDLETESLPGALPRARNSGAEAELTGFMRSSFRVRLHGPRGTTSAPGSNRHPSKRKGHKRSRAVDMRTGRPSRHAPTSTSRFGGEFVGPDADS